MSTVSDSLDCLNDVLTNLSPFCVFTPLATALIPPPVADYIEKAAAQIQNDADGAIADAEEAAHVAAQAVNDAADDAGAWFTGAANTVAKQQSTPTTQSKAGSML